MCGAAHRREVVIHSLSVREHFAHQIALRGVKKESSFGPVQPLLEQDSSLRITLNSVRNVRFGGRLPGIAQRGNGRSPQHEYEPDTASENGCSSQSWDYIFRPWANDES